MMNLRHEWKTITLWFKLGINDPDPWLFRLWVPRGMTDEDEAKLIARTSGQVVKLFQRMGRGQPIIQGQYREAIDDNDK